MPTPAPSTTGEEAGARRLAAELLATDVDLRDPAAREAVADLLTAVHDLLARG